MTVFLRRRKPFYGGTYARPEPRHGNSAFPDFASYGRCLAQPSWTKSRNQRAELARHFVGCRAVALNRHILFTNRWICAVQAITFPDQRHFGEGGAPKFPAPQTIDFFVAPPRSESRTKRFRIRPSCLRQPAGTTAACTISLAAAFYRQQRGCENGSCCTLRKCCTTTPTVPIQRVAGDWQC